MTVLNVKQSLGTKYRGTQKERDTDRQDRKRHRQTEKHRQKQTRTERDKSSRGQNPLAKHAWNSASLKPK